MSDDSRCSCGDCGRCEGQYEEDMTREEWDVGKRNCPCVTSPHGNKTCDQQQELDNLRDIDHICILCGDDILEVIDHNLMLHDGNCSMETFMEIHLYFLHTLYLSYSVHLDCLKGLPCKIIRKDNFGDAYSLTLADIERFVDCYGEMHFFNASSHYEVGG